MNVRGDIMEISEFSFLNPSPDFREMNILKGIAENPEVSQQKLSRISGVVPSMINRYIYDFESKGFIVKKGKNRRRMNYYLTKEGKFRLQFLSLSFLREVAKLYVQTKEVFGEALELLVSNDYKRILLYGAGIVGGILVDVLKIEGLEPVGFADDSEVKQGELFHDVKVYAPNKIDSLDYDAVIISSFNHSQDILEKAKQLKLNNLMEFELSDDGVVSLKEINKEFEEG
jgi:DNA-binding MarR family transcriptional regulator